MSRNITQDLMAFQKLFFLFVVNLIFIQCSSPENQLEKESEYGKELSAKLYTIRNEDSLQILLKQFSDRNDEIGKMICYKNLGSLQRASASYDDAISNHHKGLTIALRLNDTLEIVEAMNNLGADYNRIGVHDESSKIYYQALLYGESWSKKHTPTGIKNLARSLNGIGNISLMFGYYNDAEKYFREALKYENLQQSPREEAINYANLGTVFELNHEYDSAYTYYQKSLEKNYIAKSNIGVGLSMLKLGELYEKEQKYDLAKTEYQKAYELLDENYNRWHWLQACLSIARVHFITDDIPTFKYYIDLAEITANEIKSPVHVAEVYLQKHNYHTKQGNFQIALERYKQYISLKDSVQGTQKASRYVESRLMHEQSKSTLHVQQIEAANDLLQQKREYIILISWIIIFVTLIIIASLYYAYRQRAKSNKILKKLETTRSDFFTNITHELRSPLCVIQGLNKQMQEKKNITEIEKMSFMRAIERQSGSLLNLVNQLLDIAKLKKGSDDPQWKYGNIIAYLEMTAEAYKIYAGEKGINLIFYSNKEVIKMDFIPSYIDKILSNLLSNAIKHTSAGGKIEFVVAKRDKSNSLSINVKDNGEGIPQEDLNHIFDIFYQSPNTINTSGTGIGLAFTEMMIGKMKGKIDVESDLGEGTIFTIHLPINQKFESYASLFEEEEKSCAIQIDKQINILENEDEEIIIKELNNNSKPLILIVEDNCDNVLYYKSILKNQYDLITAWNGEEGLNLAKKDIPDLIISDLMMPVMDGYQFVNEIKQNNLLNHIPIIVVTAKATDETYMKCLKFGVDSYITKPFYQDELLIRIENILENRRILKEKYMNTIINNENENRLFKDVNIEFLQTITSIIHTEISNPALNSSFLAEIMSMSQSQLNRKINGIAGYSTMSYVLKIKLNKAKELITNEDMSVAEISDTCGFYDASHFSRLFKKEFGVAPSHFKKMNYV